MNQYSKLKLRKRRQAAALQTLRVLIYALRHIKRSEFIGMTSFYRWILTRPLWCQYEFAGVGGSLQGIGLYCGETEKFMTPKR
jgi:hypothetical protein